MNWQDFLPIAQAIVVNTRAKYPGSEHAFLGGGGGSDSAFSRKGTGYHYRFYDVPPGISQLVTQNASSAGIPTSLQPLQTAAFSRLLQDTPESQPGYSQLAKVANMDPTAYPGKSGLERVAAVDPYSGQYESDTFDAYQQRASDALATVNTGPQAVRGGDSRGSLAAGVATQRLAQDRGDEVRRAQSFDVNNLLNASLGSAQAEGQRYGVVRDSALGLSNLVNSVGQRTLGAAQALDVSKLNATQLLQLAASLQGTTTDKQVDDFSGRGDQSGWQAGLSCCFIYLEALNGALPWYIEIARKHFWTLQRRNGYKWMASWLVPAMKKSGVVKRLVNAVMVKPALRFTAWFYGEPKASCGWLWWPVCQMWLQVWNLIGGIYGRLSRTS